MKTIRTERARNLVAGWRVRCSLGVLICSSAIILSAGHAAADPPSEREQARSHFARGVSLAKQRSYEDALAEFARAYELSPHFSVLYNIGQAQVALQRHAEAVQTLERYLSEGGSQISAARRAEVEATLQREQARAREVEAEKPRSTREFDDNAAPAPATTVPPPAAPHPTPATATPTPTPATDAPATDAPAPRTPEPAPNLRPRPALAAGHDPRKTWAYVLGGAGVALAGAGLVHYAWNVGRHQDWEDQYDAYYLDPRPERRDAANDLAGSIDRASKVSVGLFVGAGVALGAASFLLLSSSDGRAEVRASLGRDTLVSVGGAF